MIYYNENYTPPAATCKALTAKNIENLYKAPFFRSAYNRLFPAAGNLHKSRRGKDRGTGPQTRGKPKKTGGGICPAAHLYAATPAFIPPSPHPARISRGSRRAHTRAARATGRNAAPRNSAPSTSDAGSVSQNGIAQLPNCIITNGTSKPKSPPANSMTPATGAITAQASMPAVSTAITGSTNIPVRPTTLQKPRATASLHFERAKFWKSPHSVLY